VEFTEDDLLNRYLNSIRNQDFFLKKLFDQYKELGLYEDTVFVVLGDHGEAFGEHDRYQHDNVPYEEGLRIPLLVHDPRWCGNSGCESGWSIETPVNQLDILPTVTDLLGYRLEGSSDRGSSLLSPVPEDRTLMTSCLADDYCLASVEGTNKYIYHFDNQPEEFFDLSKDPEERKNLAEERDSEELEERRSELLEWSARVDSRYVP
jgi:arylsulfatase A-like enzyme